MKSDPQKPNPKIGIGLMEWSADSSMLHSRADDLPNALYIWDARQVNTHKHTHSNTHTHKRERERRIDVVTMCHFMLVAE